MSTEAALYRRKGRSNGWAMVLAAVAVLPVLYAIATVAAGYLTETEVATRVMRKAKPDGVIKRTLDVAQLVGDAVGYLDGLRRSGFR